MGDFLFLHRHKYIINVSNSRRARCPHPAVWLIKSCGWLRAAGPTIMLLYIHKDNFVIHPLIIYRSPEKLILHNTEHFTC